MKLHLEVDPNNEQDLAQAFAVLHSFSSSKPETAPKKTATPEKPPVDNDHVAEGAEKFPEDTAVDVNIDDVRKCISSLLDAGKRTEVKALLKQFDATSATTLDEAKFAEFIAAAEEL